MSMSVKKFNVEIIPDTQKKLATVEYEDGTIAEFIAERGESFYLTTRKVGRNSLSKVHYRFYKCVSANKSINPKLTYLPAEVTCEICKKHYEKEFLS